MTTQYVERSSLNPRTRPLYPLQDWTERDWQEKATPAQRKQLRAVLGYGGSLSELLGGKLTTEQWIKVDQLQNEILNHGSASKYYLSNDLRTNYMYDRDFPLGIDETKLKIPFEFAAEHSGDARISYDGTDEEKHRLARILWTIMYIVLTFVLIVFFKFLRSDAWNMSATVTDYGDPNYSIALNKRTKTRGTVASIFTCLTFSFLTNAMLDRYGKIEPSTSTVFVGLLLGGTWGYILDNMLGSDEGFREYRWSPASGMAYALGTLTTERYARFFVSLLFEMYFATILFKHLYSRAIHLPGLAQQGKEWIANGVCSFVIAILAYQVYTNMTRFQWAYPSGIEDYRNPWISGSQIVYSLCTIAMVYLTAETRLRVGETGINSPNIKILVVVLTFVLLAILQVTGIIDPSNLDSVELPAPTTNAHEALPGVCDIQQYAWLGLLLFLCLTAGCIGVVVFGTSAQTWDGIFGSNEHRRTAFHTKCVLFSGGFASVLCYLIIFSLVPFWWESSNRQFECQL